MWGYNGFTLSIDLARSHDQGAMWPYWWEPVIVSHHPTKFGIHERYGSVDTMFLVVDEQDYTCSLISTLTAFSRPHEMTQKWRLTAPSPNLQSTAPLPHKYCQACPIKLVRDWSYASWVTI